MIQTIAVALPSGGYNISVERGLLGRAGIALRPVLRGPRVLPVTDRTVAGTHLPRLEAGLQEGGFEVLPPIILEPGEQTKSLGSFEALIETMLDRAMDRAVTVLALGGGVVGDLAGFAAATVLRGVSFVQVPTTLLAQVDSSIGGKTGINTRHGKNLLGAFYQPAAVLIDPDVLATLPRRELQAGYAEVLKYGLIDDAAFFGWCEANGEKLIGGDLAAREHAIIHACRAKARIVTQDERESGARMLLNLGHTFAHALETESGYGAGLLHGEAVAVGLVLAARLSVRLGLCEADLPGRISAHLEAVGLPARIADTPCRNTPPDRLLTHMQHDKKAQDGQLTFILLRGTGQAFIARDIGPSDVLSVLTP